MLEVDRVTFQYPGEDILLKRLSFSIARGEVVTLLGSSGVGKSTLFKLLVGLHVPLEGQIALGGEVAYMMQEDLLLPWRDVQGNLELMEELRQPSLPWETELERVGLKGYRNHFPHELSIGMRQRVSLVRALSQDCPFLLLDEPFSSLDVATRESLYAYLLEVQRERELTILLITHDFHDALQLSDRVLLLKEGEIAKEWEVEGQDLEKLKGEFRVFL